MGGPALAAGAGTSCKVSGAAGEACSLSEGAGCPRRAGVASRAAHIHAQRLVRRLRGRSRGGNGNDPWIKAGNRRNRACGIVPELLRSARDLRRTPLGGLYGLRERDGGNGSAAEKPASRFRRPRLRRPTRSPIGESSGSRVPEGTAWPNLPSYSFSFPAGFNRSSGWFPGQARKREVSYRLQRRARFRFSRNSSLCDRKAGGFSI